MIQLQEEKKARFRKYYEKKALKRIAVRQHTDSGGSSGSGSGIDDCFQEEKSRSPDVDIAPPVATTNTTSLKKPKVESEHQQTDESNVNNNNTDGSELLMDVMTADSNLVQLCLEEVDKILRETSVASTLPSTTSLSSSLPNNVPAHGQTHNITLARLAAPTTSVASSAPANFGSGNAISHMGSAYAGLLLGQANHESNCGGSLGFNGGTFNFWPNSDQLDGSLPEKYTIEEL